MSTVLRLQFILSSIGVLPGNPKLLCTNQQCTYQWKFRMYLGGDQWKFRMYLCGDQWKFGMYLGGVYIPWVYLHARWSYLRQFRSLLLCSLAVERCWLPLLNQTKIKSSKKQLWLGQKQQQKKWYILTFILTSILLTSLQYMPNVFTVVVL